VILQIIIRKFL